MKVNIAIKGGLGNQLFQYAIGSFLQNKYGCAIYFDTLPLNEKGDNLTARNLLIDQLFPEMQFTNTNTHQLFYSQNDHFLLKSYKKIYRLINNHKYITETNNISLQSGYTYYLDGYWQNLSYARAICKETNSALSLKAKEDPFAKLILDSGETAAIHIRRGDYVSNKFINSYHGNCDLSYYLNAAEQLEKLKKIDAYFIFTDDIDWAKNNLKLNKPAHIFNGDIHDPIIDLYLMKLCCNLIMSNSSLSCWAFYLNEHKNKCVFAPINWTVKNKTENLPIFDKEWILI